MEALTDFIFLGSKVTADSDCSHEIKRRLLLGRKAMTNLDSFANKSLYSQSYGFPSCHAPEKWPIRRLSAEELMLSNFGAGEDSWESLRQQGD